MDIGIGRASTVQQQLNRMQIPEQARETAQSGFGDIETTMESAASAESNGFCTQLFNIFVWIGRSFSHCIPSIFLRMFGISNKSCWLSTDDSDSSDTINVSNSSLPTPTGSPLRELDESDDESDRSVTVGQLRSRLLQGNQSSNGREPQQTFLEQGPDRTSGLMRTLARNQELIRRLTPFSALQAAIRLNALNSGGYMGSREHVLAEFNRLHEEERNAIIARMGLLAESNHDHPVSQVFSREPDWGRRVIDGIVRGPHESADRPDIQYHSDHLFEDGSLFRQAIHAIESERRVAINEM